MKLALSERDRICFLGDSITAGGLWIAEVFEYFAQRYPEKKIELYNCGISGSKGYEAEIHNRLYCDFFNFFPKYGVIMFGMNDINRSLESDNSREKERYVNTIENIVSKCKERCITPILCSPTPYDEYNDLDAKNEKVDGVLAYLHDVVKQVADKNNLIFVDMRKPLIENMDKKPIRDDRVHPNEYGQHLMAQAFISAIEGCSYIFESEKFVISEKNKKRFEIEQKIRNIMFIERDYLGWQYSDKFLSIKERKSIVQEKIAITEFLWAKEAYEKYLKFIDNFDELKGELILKTTDMYK